MSGTQEITPQEEIENEPTDSLLEASKTVEENAEEQKEEEKPKHDKNRYSRRIEELNTKFREEQRERERLAEENKQLKEATRIKEEPNEDNYDDPDKLEADKKQWRQQEEARIREEERNAIKQEALRENQQKETQKIISSYNEQRQKAVEKDPNYKLQEIEVNQIIQSQGEYAVVARDSILKSKNSTAIVSHLGSNPDELRKIVLLSPLDQAEAIFELRKELEAKPVKKSSTAPDPIRSEKGGAKSPGTNKGMSQGKNESFAEFCARMKK